MRFIKFRSLAAISAALCFLAPRPAPAATPRYGGTLHVKLRASSISLDPREWLPGSPELAANEKLASLVYDRLVTLDDYGKFQPALAVEWSHDASSKNWQFKLRQGVKLSNGAPLASADVATSLRTTLDKSFEVTATDTSVSIRSSHSAPDLLEQLASGRHFIFRVLLDGSLLGTGPFFVAESAPAGPSEANPSAIKPAHFKFQANEAVWSGRPFLDAVEITYGEPALRQLFDLQLGKADIAEIAPDLVRKARQEGLRIWSSAPSTLVALRFDDSLAAPAADRLRESLALALDRDTMANVLLQREAQPAAALLPQWLSGYAFLFASPWNLERAKSLRAAFPANEVGASQPLRLRVDVAGDLFRLMGERVAVNARQANLTVQVNSAPANASFSNTTAAGLHLFAWQFDSLSPREDLEDFVQRMQFVDTDVAGNLADPEQLYAQERRLLESRRILPLMLFSDFIGIRGNVHNWNAASWGDWRLADVWLDSDEALPAKSALSNPGNNSKSRTPGARP